MTNPHDPRNPKVFADEMRTRLNEIQQLLSDKLPDANWVLAIEFDGMGTVVAGCHSPAHAIALLANAIRASVDTESHMEYVPDADTWQQ